MSDTMSRTHIWHRWQQAGRIHTLLLLRRVSADRIARSAARRDRYEAILFG